MSNKIPVARCGIATVAMALMSSAFVQVPVAADPVDRSAARSFSAESARLSEGLAEAVRESGLDELVDFDNRVRGVAQPAEFLPNVDVAVIELSRRGRVLGAANVLYDRDSPDGYQVEVDRRRLRATGVEFSAWDIERFNDADTWAAGPSDSEVLQSPGDVRKEFMTTYPASVLKIMVAHAILRLVDQGRLDLGDEVAYAERAGKTCGYGPSNPEGLDPAPAADGATDTVAGWMDQMITVSDNFATCVLLQEIHDRGALKKANGHFHRLGLSTLRMLPAEPAVGNGWSTGRMSMGALDTAKLMLVASGAPGRLWTAPDGTAVTADAVLSERSQRFYRRLLAEQSFNEVLNPVNLCGSDDAVQGIPSTVSERWVDDKSGHVVTYDGDLAIDFGYDVRPCVRKAEVRFMHKTGLVSFSGSDAGIVKALPGQDGRWYVVAVQSSVGYRFGDPDWAKSRPNACLGAPYVCYPRGFGRIGKAVDRLVEDR